jgi:hypothetical protein
MMAKNPTGLGDPLLSGKRSLFQPPKKSNKPRKKEQQTPHIRQKIKAGKPKVKRIRTTTELTPQAITVIQEVQQRYRLQTGKVLPVWKIISQAIERHGRSADNEGEG